MNGKTPESSVRAEGEELAEHLRRIAQARTREQRDRAMTALATMLHGTKGVLPFLNRLMQGDRNGQRLALEIAARLPLPLDREIYAMVQPLLGDARFSSSLRINVGVQLLRSISPQSKESVIVFESLVHGIPTSRAVNRLRAVESRLPDHPGLRGFLANLERQATLACPRCAVRLTRPNLIVHLWQEHRLMLDGSRAREPWKMIEGWLEDYARTGRRELLERSSELGEQLDPQNGLIKVHRILLAAGLTDEEAHQNLHSLARGRRACLCPHCYALVQERPEWIAPTLDVTAGRIAAQGYEVELSETAIFTRLFVDGPDGVIHHGLEPGRSLSRRGRVILLIGPVVLTALALAVLLPVRIFPPLTPVAVLLIAAFLLYLRLRISGDPRVDIAHRVVDHAWYFLAPMFHRPEFSRADAEFLAGLARTSMGIGTPQLRHPVLERVAKVTQTKIRSRTVAPEFLTALRCLEMDDAVRAGLDPLMILADQLGSCFASELPLLYGEQLLDAWPDEDRDRGQRARLRILLCARAFELGFEARDLQELGQICPLIGQAYASEDVAGLTHLRWLWEIKPSRSWQSYGTATTAFDLARYPALGGQFLEARPDLLLFQPTSDIGSDADATTPILICEEGIVYRNIVIRDPATSISVKEQPGSGGEGYDLIIGKQRVGFPADPTMTAKRLQVWVKFLFRDFLPNSASLKGRRSPGKLKNLVWQKTMLCPECEHPFLALRGEVGIITDTEVK